MRLILLSLITTWATSSQLIAQNIVNGRNIELNPYKLVLHNSNNQFEATGTYCFGESEWESSLYILKSENGYIAQFHYTDVIDIEPNPFVPRFVNLENVKIENGVFFANGWEGQFAFCNDTSFDSYPPDIINSNGLIILEKPPSPKLIFVNEFGIKYDGFPEFMGKYPEASYRLLQESDLHGMSKNELRIMRNEIFARYSYDFRDGGEMEHYFNNTTWYRPVHSNVDSYLTEIEKYNIELIRRFE